MIRVMINYSKTIYMEHLLSAREILDSISLDTAAGLSVNGLPSLQRLSAAQALRRGDGFRC